MTENCTSIDIKEEDNGRIFLKGIITGLSSSKEYCLLYIGRSGWVNLPNISYDYTYFTTRTAFDLDAG